MPTKRDYYEVLGVGRDAGDKEIKKAFRALAREIHPDVNADDPEAEAKFKEAAEAYEVLANSETRATYDRYGHEGLKRGGFQDFGQFSFEDIIRTFFGQGMFGDDIFGMGGRGRRGPARGADVGAAAEISLREAATGVTREIDFDTIGLCEPCGGSGAAAGTSPQTCSGCGGAGQMRTVQRTPFGQMMSTVPCASCAGTGTVIESPCPECSRGRIQTHRTMEVEIPPGISSGQSIRLTGQGGAGEQGASAGDLFVQVTVNPDPKLQRDGNDLIQHLPVTMVDAALGATVSISTLEGDEDLELKPGLQPGEVITLKGRGMPQLRGHGRGVIKIVVDVMVPRNLTDEQKELLRRFSEETGAKHYNRESSLFEKIRSAFR